MKSSKGNPYHDERGRFCSAANAGRVAVSGKYVDVSEMNKKDRAGFVNELSDSSYYEKQTKDRENGIIKKKVRRTPSSPDRNSMLAASADECFENALKEAKISEDKAHLLDYGQWKGVETTFKTKMREKNVDLSFKKATSPKYGFMVSGNRDGISSGYHLGIMKKGWEKTDSFDLGEAKGFYEKDKFGYPQKVSRERFLKIASVKNHEINMGIGSQSSRIVCTTGTYRDKFGNLLVERSALKYD